LSELFYFYQILIAFKNLKILSEVAHANCKRLKLFEGTVFGRSRTSSDKNPQIVEGGQYFLEVILMPKSMTQEEHVGLFSCN
jgi:hypothetical protein